MFQYITPFIFYIYTSRELQLLLVRKPFSSFDRHADGGNRIPSPQQTCVY